MNSFKKFLVLILPLVFIGVTCVSLVTLFNYVDLKPKVEENFFFSEDDPQFQIDTKIASIFPQPQQVLISVRGSIYSDYLERMKLLTDEIDTFEEVASVQSMTKGPKNMTDILESPLWKRVLLSSNKESSNILIFLKLGVTPDQIVPKLEYLKGKYETHGFEILISGIPYINELIRRNLENDLKKFSIASAIVFGLVVVLIFRSFWVVLGTVVACANASCLTLIVNQFMKFEIGVLTANLSTIVFVLTLSHIVFLTFNWKYSVKYGGDITNASWEAVKVTFTASFWSMLTTFLGFVSLLFVEAEPIRNLGVCGAIGTCIAFVVAYLFYPWFLHIHDIYGEGKHLKKPIKDYRHHFLSRQHGIAVFFIIILCILTFSGIHRLNVDPSLISYFKQGGEIREGIEYVDSNGGSSPVNLVIDTPEGVRLNTESSYRKMWDLNRALETIPDVGMVISLPIMMAEARRVPFAKLISWERLLQFMDLPKYDEVGKYFITKDRKKGFFILRMKEANRQDTRENVVNQINQIVNDNGFIPEFLGGAYLLQKKLSELIVSSLQMGLALLIGLFVLMSLSLSRSMRVTWAMFISLCLIPFTLLGLMGYFKIPLEIISTPSVNLAIAMGVDAMIHTLIFVRRYIKKEGQGYWDAWVQARIRLWKPILFSMIIISSGFGIFALSNFPPTQRFGICVIIGSCMAPLVAIFVLPYLAGVPLRREWSPSKFDMVREGGGSKVSST